MVPAEYEEVLGIFDLVCKQKADGLKRLFTSVDIISQEEVICFWWKAAVLEKTEEVIILTMNVTADLIYQT